MSDDGWLESVEMPANYQEYYKSLLAESEGLFETALDAKSTLVDSTDTIDTRIARDLSERVAEMHELPISDRLRELLNANSKEMTALYIAQEIAGGKYMGADSTMLDKLEMAVRVGLAVVTEGVTIAPLQGINNISIKENKDGTRYLSVSIAGPMRAAGGTESAATLLIADYVRREAGLDRYQADSFDDESGRFVEELRVYEREVHGGNFQYHVSDRDIITVIRHLPVELDGVDTDDFDVVNHKNMVRIKTDRVRGGALRVLNDGLIGRAKKLLKRVEMYRLDGWEWLSTLEGAEQTGDKEDASTKRMHEVITGRSVLSMPNRHGGFRLRYGRACNTGFATIGFHPAVSEVLDHVITVGTQVKTDIPGKGATVAFVDSIEPPTVLLENGDVVKLSDARHGAELRPRIRRILQLGDVLISFGDFLENNAKLAPSGYVEEIWELDLSEAGAPSGAHAAPTAREALELSTAHGIPLHPRHLYFWDAITPADLDTLARAHRADGDAISYPVQVKPILERLAVPHRNTGGRIVLEGDEAIIFENLLVRPGMDVDPEQTVLENLTRMSGVKINPKSSISIGVRIGRPEKAAARAMNPPTHVLFPVGEQGGASRDLIKASQRDGFLADVVNRACKGCGTPALGLRCRACGDRVETTRTCPACRAVLTGDRCVRCDRRAVGHSGRTFPLKAQLAYAQEGTGLHAQIPLKGVKGLMSFDRIAEPLEKGLIRQHHNLTIFKDGTIRYDTTNCTLTHFRPSWIGTPVATLRKLGYRYDVDGRPLEDGEQVVEMLMQDVVIPSECGSFLTNVAKYIDAELGKLYGKEPYYNAQTPEDLLGHLVMGLAPHTSVGIVGRIIGYTDTQVCFATPSWHSSKRRDADGDADSIMLVLDCFLNFSRSFLSERIGGLMDTPLLVQPTVMPYEAQLQAHNLEAVESFSREFYDAAKAGAYAAKAGCVKLIKEREGAELFRNYYFTHHTRTLVSSKSRSSYSTAGSMLDKCDMQLRNAELVDAVDVNTMASDVISTHLVPDIMGNLRAYATQQFRCVTCGLSYRRIPLTGTCPKNHKIIANITRPSVEKYLGLAKRLAKRYDVGEYQRGRIKTLADEIDLVFGKGAGDQALLSDF